MLKSLWRLLVLSIGYANLMFFLSAQFTISIPPAIPAVLGTAVSLLLGFRTNAAYNKGWETRKIWGSIVNNTRTFARTVRSFIPKNYPEYRVTVKDAYTFKLHLGMHCVILQETQVSMMIMNNSL